MLLFLFFIFFGSSVDLLCLFQFFNFFWNLIQFLGKIRMVENLITQVLPAYWSNSSKCVQIQFWYVVMDTWGELLTFKFKLSSWQFGAISSMNLLSFTICQNSCRWQMYLWCWINFGLQVLGEHCFKIKNFIWLPFKL